MVQVVRIDGDDQSRGLSEDKVGPDRDERQELQHRTGLPINFCGDGATLRWCGTERRCDGGAAH